MSLSSAQLDAFVALSRHQSFSRAAEALHITQSALSQRIMKLEEELALTLFIREPHEVRLTPPGERLLRYCQLKDSLEEESLSDMKATGKKTLTGNLRIAGYSSVVRSVVVPALSNFLRTNSDISFQFFNREMKDLPALLQRGEADFIVLDYHWEKAGIARDILGKEEYVVIQEKSGPARADHFLDHDPADLATERFFADHKKPPAYSRSFLDDVYGVLDGVKLGLGQAVMSKHLLKDSKDISVVRTFKSKAVEVVLHYYKQPYYSRLHTETRDALVKNCSKLLSTSLS